MRKTLIAAVLCAIATSALAESAPCEAPVNEMRCRLAITERELIKAQANAIVMEGRMRLREQELVVLEAKAKWLTGLVWPSKKDTD